MPFDVHNNRTSKLITDGTELMKDILYSSCDSIEKTLYRTTYTIVGLLAGPFTLGVIGTPFIANAYVDSQKLAEIKAKYLDLHTTRIQSENPEFEQAKIAYNFQEQAYKNIEEYTRTARKIKLTIGVGAAVASWSGWTFFSGGFLIQPIAGITFLGLTAGLTTAAVGTGVGIYHKLFNGAKLSGANQALANQAFKALSFR